MEDFGYFVLNILRVCTRRTLFVVFFFSFSLSGIDVFLFCRLFVGEKMFVLHSASLRVFGCVYMCMPV